MPEQEYTRYRAFISYSHRDKKCGDWLHKTLETYRVPKPLVGQPSRTGPVPKRIYPIFRDREELPTRLAVSVSPHYTTKTSSGMRSSVRRERVVTASRDDTAGVWDVTRDEQVVTAPGNGVRNGDDSLAVWTTVRVLHPGFMH